LLASLVGGGGLAVEEPQEVQDEEYERVYERVAAVDVAKACGVVCTGCRMSSGRAGGGPGCGR